MELCVWVDMHVTQFHRSRGKGNIRVLSILQLTLTNHTLWFDWYPMIFRLSSLTFFSPKIYIFISILSLFLFCFVLFFFFFFLLMIVGVLYGLIKRKIMSIYMRSHIGCWNKRMSAKTLGLEKVDCEISHWLKRRTKHSL